MKRLEALLSHKTDNLPKFMRGYVPRHFKRLSVPLKKAFELAIEGDAVIGGAFNDVSLYFTQALIAGAILSPDYDTITIVTPSQYGKSWLLGHVALYMAYKGRPLYLAGATQDTTDIIMRHVVQAAQVACPEIRNAFQGQSLDRLDKLTKSLSKTRLSAGEGFVESITLGDTYSGQVSRNKAVGRGGDFIIDEAALCSEDALSEIGRREFASTDGNVFKLIMISNPHSTGFFYDHLTEDHPGDRDFILWIDALTAVEEGRFTAKQVLESDFAKHQSTRVRYLLCELDASGLGMFPAPVIAEPPQGDKKYFVGVDAAYKGKDNIELCLVSVCDGKIHIEEIETLEKKQWIDGVTSEDIIRDISTVVGYYHVGMVCNDIGFGVWLTEGLARRSVNVRGINFGAGPTKEREKAKHYAAKEAAIMRAEMHIDLQDLMSNNLVTWSAEAARKVKDVLPAITSQRKTNGKIQIRPKSEIKALIGKSPDEFDSVLLAVHAAILASGEDNSFLT